MELVWTSALPRRHHAVRRFMIEENPMIAEMRLACCSTLIRQSMRNILDYFRHPHSLILLS
jgi:hypothetical protein